MKKSRVFSKTFLKTFYFSFSKKYVVATGHHLIYENDWTEESDTSINIVRSGGEVMMKACLSDLMGFAFDSRIPLPNSDSDYFVLFTLEFQGNRSTNSSIGNNVGLERMH